MVSATRFLVIISFVLVYSHASLASGVTVSDWSDQERQWVTETRALYQRQGLTFTDTQAGVAISEMRAKAAPKRGIPVSEWTDHEQKAIAFLRTQYERAGTPVTSEQEQIAVENMRKRMAQQQSKLSLIQGMLAARAEADGSAPAQAEHLVFDEITNVAKEPIELAWDRWVNEGLLGGAVRASDFDDPKTNYLRLRVKGLENVRIRVFRSASFLFKGYNVLSVDQYLPAMREVKADISKICSSGGGDLVRYSFGYFPAPEVIPASRIAELGRESLYGDFLCSSPSGSLFQIQIYPAPKGAGMALLGNFNWNIYVHLLTKAQLSIRENKLSARKQEEEAQTVATRESLQPGANVAVQALDLPDSIIRSASVKPGWLEEKKFMLCGMVIDVKPAIVQVQIGKDTIYLAKNKIFPFVRSVSPSAHTGTDAVNWSQWCFM